MWLIQATYSVRSPFAQLLLFVIVSAAPATTVAFEPTSPAVKLLAFRGIKYLESTTGRESQMRHVGGQALLGYTILKYHRRYDIGGGDRHPRVVKAIREIRKLANAGTTMPDLDVYQLSIGLNLLLEVETESYGRDIQAMLDELLRRQRPDGSWSYPNDATGDTSQTQFAVLSLYIARNRQYAVPSKALSAACNWLLRTQDPSGSWGYHGNDPGLGNYTRIDQAQVGNEPNYNTAHSDTAAGAASLYITAQMLRLLPNKSAKTPVPKNKGSLRRVQRPDKEPLSQEVDTTVLRDRRKDADRWFGGHQSIEAKRWQYYYLYTLERYQTLREITSVPDKWKWYDEGVAWLSKQQKRDGRWTDNKGGPAVSTCFAILFLIRNTQTLQPTSLEFVGGRLDGPTTNFGPEGAPQVEIRRTTLSEDELLKILVSRASRMDPKTIPAAPPRLRSPQSERSRQRRMIESLLNQPQAELRLETIRLLVRQKKNLDHVPLFIHALTDPDRRVRFAARNILRKWSRIFDGFGVSDSFQHSQLVRAQANWRRWYHRVRPDAD